MMKPYETDDYKALLEYERFPDVHEHFFCWACGRTGNFRDKPRWWGGPWLIERAHIVNKPRARDRRAVILLCSLCHKLQHGHRFSEVNMPGLSVEHMRWLKYCVDHSWYDEDFLKKHSVRQDMTMLEPSRQYQEEFINRRMFWWKMRKRQEAEPDVLRIGLPMPSAILSPNGRSHWAVKNRAAQAQKALAVVAANLAQRGKKRNWVCAQVVIKFYCKDKRRRDVDNYLARLKSAFDGLQIAGVITDDSGFAYGPITFEVDKTNERVELEIRPLGSMLQNNDHNDS